MQIQIYIDLEDFIILNVNYIEGMKTHTAYEDDVFFIDWIGIVPIVITIYGRFDSEITIRKKRLKENNLNVLFTL